MLDWKTKIKRRNCLLVLCCCGQSPSSPDHLHLLRCPEIRWVSHEQSSGISGHLSKCFRTSLPLFHCIAAYVCSTSWQGHQEVWLRQEVRNDLELMWDTAWWGMKTRGLGFKSEPCHTGETMLALDLELFHLWNQVTRRFRVRIAHKILLTSKVVI